MDLSGYACRLRILTDGSLGSNIKPGTFELPSYKDLYFNKKRGVVQIMGRGGLQPPGDRATKTLPGTFSNHAKKGSKMAGLKAKVRRNSSDVITLEITKEDFEAFCAAAGLYRKEFLDVLDASAKDHKAGRIKERKNLYEIINED